ncbi:MAG: M28 family peptidase [Bacteroidetes bacterium]|nr:M28 family peptidase [Bacteroidota bacterium]MCL1968149.1 M28 family peptidase [Bacteroidota bacterium]
MKRFILISFALLCLTVSAQQVIDNKGNRNQSYPVITKKTPEIVNLINNVSQNNIENSIRYMQQFIRDCQSPEALTVQNWLIEHFESYGYDDISIHYFNYFGQQLAAGNVVVVKKGTEFPDEYILITSHYDHPDGPGADDNASGTSGVLECARLLKDFPAKRSIMFVPFNAEEKWMVGSLPFVQKCASENMNIIAVLNMDMIGWFPPANPNTIMASGYSYISKALFEYYQQTANVYIPSIPTIRLSAGDSYGGDHMPFNMYAYPALYIGDIEYHSQHPCYHKPCDTIGEFGGVNRLDLAKAFVQATLASAAELVNAWLPPQNLSACSGTDKITVSWDKNNESTSYKIFRNSSFLKETSENFYIDTKVEVGEKYEYYVIAVNNSGQETAPSNTDEITFVKPLQLPYSNNFRENKYGFEQSDWVFRNESGVSSLSNTSGNGTFTDNYLSIAELDWFPIPANTKNISICFKWTGDIRGIWSSGHNAGMFFEVTTDRKTWHKLAYITGSNSWTEHQITLNPYINSNFFQARFRLESSGSQEYSYTKLGCITDVKIFFESNPINVKENLPYISSFNFTPNPASTYINVETRQEEPYHIAIYDMTGKVVFAQDGFRDGTLNIAHLSKGAYLLVVSKKQHRVARKLVIE